MIVIIVNIIIVNVKHCIARDIWTLCILNWYLFTFYVACGLCTCCMQDAKCNPGACQEWIEIQRCVVILDDAPNYYPNSFSGPEVETGKLDSQFSASGDVARYNTADDDNFTQVGNFWRKVRHFSHCSC